MLKPEEVSAWTMAAEDLGITVSIHRDAVLVKDFGSVHGTLCAVLYESDEISALIERAESQGMGYSVLGGSYAEYARALFIEMLTDWGWSGEGEPPTWYRGQRYR